MSSGWSSTRQPAVRANVINDNAGHTLYFGERQ